MRRVELPWACAPDIVGVLRLPVPPHPHHLHTIWRHWVAEMQFDNGRCRWPRPSCMMRRKGHSRNNAGLSEKLRIRKRLRVCGPMRRTRPSGRGSWPSAPSLGRDSQPSDGVDFAEVRGQDHANCALEAAAGAHNLLMAGPPGSIWQDSPVVQTAAGAPCCVVLLPRRRFAWGSSGSATALIFDIMSAARPRLTLPSTDSKAPFLR